MGLMCALGLHSKKKRLRWFKCLPPEPEGKAFDLLGDFSSLFELLLVGNRLVAGGVKKNSLEIRWKIRVCRVCF
jgi:hypothetical protein